MDRIFENAKWIWNSTDKTKDSYCEFAGEFSHRDNERVYLSISFDSICNVWLNGKLIFFKQCADYPFYKLYDRVDITEYCTKENEIRFFVWYLGEDSAVYYANDPGLLFEVCEGDNVILASGKKIRSRADIRYKQGYRKNITQQLGYSFFYDNTLENYLPFTDSVELPCGRIFEKSSLKMLKLADRSDSRIISETRNNVLCDLGEETTGFLSFEIESSRDQTITIAYGEHIKDGNVRQKIGPRDFSVEIRLRAGRNTYTNFFRRLAGRYLSVYFEYPVKVSYLGLLPVIYPVEKKSFSAENELQQRIYDVCQKTLTLCMHEHYEDCPWREQALYIMDSRNQMLCGYYCFGEYPYARQNLVLISKGLKDNGLLELTYPAKNTPAIPFFSLIFPMAVYEYIEHSGDRSILQEVSPVIQSIIRTFERHFSENNGLLANLPYPFWNFYEWSNGSSNEDEIERGADEPYREQYDLILNCAYLLSVEYSDKIFGTHTNVSELKDAIRRHFYDSSSGLFRATVGKDLYTELGNSLAILAGLCTQEEEKRIAEGLKDSCDMVSVTLSMQCFKYDALLRADRKNADYILRDIETNYGKMLSFGATSFWETANGESDFDGAGSLCHGWSAMPIYYFHTLKKADSI